MSYCVRIVAFCGVYNVHVIPYYWRLRRYNATLLRHLKTLEHCNTRIDWKYVQRQRCNTDAQQHTHGRAARLVAWRVTTRFDSQKRIAQKRFTKERKV